MSSYCFTVASTDTGKHKELWVLGTRILAEKIRNTRSKKFPVSEVFEVDMTIHYCLHQILLSNIPRP